MTPNLPTPTPAVTDPVSSEALARELLIPFLLSAALAIGIVLFALLLARIARITTLRALDRTRADRSTALLVGRISFLLVTGLGALIALGVVGVPWATVITIGGVFGLAASLAMQDVLKNFVAGLYLLVERPFRIGEFIRVRDFVGEVETVNVRTTVLRAENGEAILVPNAILFAEVILNQGLSPTPPRDDSTPPIPGSG